MEARGRILVDKDVLLAAVSEDPKYEFALNESKLLKAKTVKIAMRI